MICPQVYCSILIYYVFIGDRHVKSWWVIPRNSYCKLGQVRVGLRHSHNHLIGFMSHGITP